MNGENPVSGYISGITSEVNSVVTCVEDARHGLEDGDYVIFKEVKGMEGLNSTQPIPIKTLGPFTFSIGDTTGFGNYLGGGIFEQIKQPKTFHFVLFCVSCLYFTRNHYAKRLQTLR